MQANRTRFVAEGEQCTLFTLTSAGLLTVSHGVFLPRLGHCSLDIQTTRQVK